MPNYETYILYGWEVDYEKVKAYCFNTEKKYNIYEIDEMFEEMFNLAEQFEDPPAPEWLDKTKFPKGFFDVCWFSKYDKPSDWCCNEPNMYITFVETEEILFDELTATINNIDKEIMSFIKEFAIKMGAEDIPAKVLSAVYLNL